MEKHIATSKTIWFGVALFLLDVFPHVQAGLAEYLPSIAEHGAAFIGLVTIILRLATHKPIRLSKGG